MSTSVKTAISMQQHLFDDVNVLAGEMNVSRSKLFVLAIEEFMKKNDSKKMLAQINSAYSDAPDATERKTASAMKRKQRQALEHDAW